MNKKILVGIAIAVIAIAVAVVGAKTILGDKALALPGEEHTEKALNIQENKTTVSSTGLVKSGSAPSGESAESGP
ncbi:MAG: hypothetical protein P4K92_05750 [Candidatus Nitrosotalea sp.]|nr:hypothetical protein [Candidatus Nitrosotalea sp.]